MDHTTTTAYNQIGSGGTGFYEQKRGLIEVRGNEAAQFLDGLVTNDVKTLDDGAQMLAAFPNAQGRLLALVRVMRQEDKFLVETEEATHERLFENLFRFTYAGDFFVEDLSDDYRFFSVLGRDFLPSTQPIIELDAPYGSDYFIHSGDADDFLTELANIDAAELTAEEFETLRIEYGVPLFGVDMSETTIVPELGLEGMISYTKGCYIGQEIIARIHFRGHVAKRLTGISAAAGRGSKIAAGTKLATADGKNAGWVTSQTISPRLNRAIALAFVRYEYLENGTTLFADGAEVAVTDLPFV